MNYLIDTNILSELRKGSRRAASVHKWCEGVDSDALFVSVLLLGEVRKGAELKKKKDAPQAKALTQWLSTLQKQFSQRTLPVTLEVALEWGRMNAKRPLPTIDSLMAATAKVHGMTLVTRNTKDLRGCGAKLLNPFSR